MAWEGAPRIQAGLEKYVSRAYYPTIFYFRTVEEG